MATSIADVFVTARLDSRYLGTDLRKAVESPTVTSAGTTAGRVTGEKFSVGMRETAVAGTKKTSVDVSETMTKGALSAGLGYGKRFGGAMRESVGEYAKSTAALVGGFFAYEKVKEFFVGSIEQAESLEKVQRLTEAAITSTGGAAGVTADQIGELSKRLALQVGVQDDIVQSGANMLLTFTNVRDVGGSRIFDRALQSTLDISAAMAGAGRGSTTSLKASAIQVGRALNDPIRGMTALRRVGVSFTDDQIAQVQAMIDTNNIIGAQKIVLGELSKEFGGAAESQATWTSKAHVQLQELEQDFGARLLPAVEDVSRWFARDGVAALRSFGTSLDSYVVPPLKLTADGLGAIVSGASDLPSPLKSAAFQAGVLALAVKGVGALGVTRGLAILSAGVQTLGIRLQVTNELQAAGVGGLRAYGTAALGAAGALARSRIGIGLTGAALLTLSSSVSDSHKNLKELSSVGGDIAVGFAVGGPVGAGVGFVAGLFQHWSDDTQALDDSLKQVQDTIASNPFDFAASQSALDSLRATIDQTEASSTGLVDKFKTGLDFLTGPGNAIDDQRDKLNAITAAEQDAAAEQLKLQQGVIDFNIALQGGLGKASQNVGTSAPQVAAAAGVIVTSLGNVGYSAEQVAELLKDRTGWNVAIAAVHEYVRSQDSAQGRTSALGEAIAGLDDPLKTTADAADALATALEDLLNPQLDLQRAQDTYTLGLRHLDTVLAKHTDTLHGNTDGAIKNRAAVADQVDALVKVLEAQGAAGASSDELAKSMREQRQRLLDAADAAGLNRHAVKDLIDEYGLTPRLITTIIDANTDQGRRKVADYVNYVKGSLNSIKDEPVDIKLTAQASKVEAELAHLGTTFATGGPVTGGSPGKDSVPALLMPGEHVWTTDEVKRAGGHGVMEGLRRLARLGELPRRGDISAFAEGGAVLDMGATGSGVESAISGMERVAAAAAAAVSAKISALVNKILTQIPGGALGLGGTLTLPQILRGQDFARSQVGKPYVWGGVGPDGYDCSGFQSAVLNSARGAYPYSRLGSTSSMPWAGSAPGVGRYTIGWTTDAGGGIGHTSGNIGGLNVESYGGHGPAVGSGARSPLDGMFNGLMHYDSGGLLRPGVTLAVNGTGRDERVVRDPSHAGGVIGGHAPQQTPQEARQQARQDARDLAKAMRQLAREMSKFGITARENASDIHGEFADLIASVRTSFGGDSPLVDRLAALGQKAVEAGRERDAKTAELADAISKLHTLLQAQRQFESSTAQSFTTDPFSGQASTVGGLIQVEKYSLARVRRFLRAENTLIHRGLDPALIRSLIGNGPDALEAAEALAHAPKAQFNQFLRLAEADRRTARQIGQVAGDRLYGAGVKAAEGVVKGLRQERDLITRELERYAERAVEAVTRRLGDAGDGGGHGHRHGGHGGADGHGAIVHIDKVDASGAIEGRKAAKAIRREMGKAAALAQRGV